MKTEKKKLFTAKSMGFTAISIALATVLSMIRIFRMPMGGSVTPFSMFFVTFPGFLFGPVMGFIGGLVYGLFQMISGGTFLSVPQVLCDYFFAFIVMGVSGFLRNRKYGLLTGYIAGVFGRFVFAVLSGVLFFAEYAEGSGHGAFIYSVLYNGGYIGAEALITCILLFIPPVRSALSKIRSFANEKGGIRKKDKEAVNSGETPEIKEKPED